MNIVRPNGKNIEHAEKKLLVYYCIGDLDYDLSAQDNPNQITQSDIDAANKLGARRKEDYYKPFLGKDISMIPVDMDLGDTSADWGSTREKVEVCLQQLLEPELKGVACASLTKLLHKKRPRLIPVCDSVIAKYVLPDERLDKKSASTITRIMYEFRIDLANNQATLKEMRVFLDEQCGEFEWMRGRTLQLTNLRMLEKLYWMEKKYENLWTIMRKQGWWVGNDKSKEVEHG
jgi:hypothetical protein